MTDDAKQTRQAAWADPLYDLLRANGVTQFAYVPDAGHTVLINRSLAEIAISVTGVAGPGGGSAEKPVGLVWFGCAREGRPTVTTHHIFPGDRAEVRRATVARALELVRAAAG
ncbi:MAG TPA: CinA family protein [Acetobacteraceae bacterium]|nr:CinA family protein [Acetobacteraceae bacterium]